MAAATERGPVLTTRGTGKELFSMEDQNPSSTCLRVALERVSVFSFPILLFGVKVAFGRFHTCWRRLRIVSDGAGQNCLPPTGKWRKQE